MRTHTIIIRARFVLYYHDRPIRPQPMYDQLIKVDGSNLGVIHSFIVHNFLKLWIHYRTVSSIQHSYIDSVASIPGGIDINLNLVKFMFVMEVLMMFCSSLFLFSS